MLTSARVCSEPIGQNTGSKPKPLIPRGFTIVPLGWDCPGLVDMARIMARVMARIIAGAMARVQLGLWLAKAMAKVMARIGASVTPSYTLTLSPCCTASITLHTASLPSNWSMFSLIHFMLTPTSMCRVTDISTGRGVHIGWTHICPLHIQGGIFYNHA